MKKMLIIFFVIVLLISIELYIDHNIIEIEEYKIVTSKLPKAFDGVKILQLSDLHSKEFESGNIGLIRKINEINPDIVVMTGDMVNSNDEDFSTFYELAQNIGVRYETYFIVGNHEMDLSGTKMTKIEEQLKEYGITTLNNRMLEIERQGEKINLYGMWYNVKYYKDKDNKLNFSEDTITKIMGDVDKNRFNLLLTHNPKYFEAYSNWGADLTLSGHVHGGMIRLPIIGALLSPDRTLFPKYNSGEYNYNDSTMIVSRGLGRGMSVFRFFNRPEIVVITLECSN